MNRTVQIGKPGLVIHPEVGRAKSVEFSNSIKLSILFFFRTITKGVMGHPATLIVTQAGMCGNLMSQHESGICACLLQTLYFCVQLTPDPCSRSGVDRVRIETELRQEIKKRANVAIHVPYFFAGLSVCEAKTIFLCQVVQPRLLG